MNKNEFLLLVDDICSTDSGTVTGDCSLINGELFDSIAILGLVAMLDKNFGIVLSMDELQHFGTIGNLFDEAISKTINEESDQFK